MNKSATFLLPLTDVKTNSVINFFKDPLNKSDGDLLLNVYYHSEEDLDFDNNYKNRIYIVFKRGISESLLKLLTKLDTFITYNYLDELMVFIFRIPQEFINDFLVFKQGRYSLLDQSYKKLIEACYFDNKNLKQIKEVLYPDLEKIKQIQIKYDTKEPINEITSKPDELKEVFRKSEYFTLKVDNKNIK